MVQEKKHKIRRLTWLLSDLEGGDEKVAVINSEDARLVKGAGLLQVYHGFDSLDMRNAEATDIIQLRATEQKAEGKRIVRSDGDFYTIEIAALKELVGKLYGKQRVSANEKKGREEHQPHAEKTTWQEREKRRVGIDRQAKVQMEVLMRPEVRPEIIALGVAHGMAGQKYIEHLIVNSINDNPDLVTKGEQYIKRAKGSIRRAIALAREDMNLSPDDSEVTPSVSRSH